MSKTPSSAERSGSFLDRLRCVLDFVSVAGAGQWSCGDSNSELPPCKGGTLPVELQPRGTGGSRTLSDASSMVGFPAQLAWLSRHPGGTRTHDFQLVELTL